MSNLKHYRLLNKLSQTEVAKKLGISQATYSDHESGKSLLNSDQILILCVLYKCTPNDLLNFKEEYLRIMRDVFDE